MTLVEGSSQVGDNKREPPDLGRLFKPRSMAIVGATDNPSANARVTYTRLRDWCNRSGVVLHPVSTTRPTVDGDRAYQTLHDVPGDIDVAVLLVSDAVSATRDAVERACRFVVVFSAGFSETGSEGAARESQLKDLVRGSNTYLLGPNTAPNLYEDFSEELPGRSLALVSQSGAQMRPVYQAQQLGVKMSHWAPTGNEADLESADFIEYYIDRPEVGVVAAYIEGFKDGRRFLRAASRAADRSVPIVMVKAGRTDLGASWAASHTGHLAGNDQVVSAACRQYGVVRVDAMDELIDTAALLARRGPAQGVGICAYTTSGGTGTLFADLARQAGLEFADLSDETISALRQWVPERQRISNPVDGASVTNIELLETLLSDPGVEVLVLPLAGSFPPLTDPLSEAVVTLSARYRKPICVIWSSPLSNEDALARLQQAQVPVFRTFRSAVTAIKAYVGFGEYLRRRQPPRSLELDGRRAEAARDLLSRNSQLSEARSKELLRLYGIPVSRDYLCRSVDEALQAAHEIGYPLVLKACGPSLAHKSDLGLVRVGLGEASEVTTAFTDLFDRARSVDPAVEGILVSELVADGIETVVGVTTDPTFGPIVMFGSGGVGIELYEDITFRIPPFDRDEAENMISEVRIARLLAGHRRLPRIDTRALAELIVTVGDLALELAGGLAELDINPLIVRPTGLVAVDALAVPVAP